jgi:hypothetical protein
MPKSKICCDSQLEIEEKPEFIISDATSAFLGFARDEFLGIAGSSATIHESLESFTLNARRWLAAFYCSVAAEPRRSCSRCCGRMLAEVFGNRVEEECDLPELEKATKAAIIVFARNFHTQTGRKLCQ